MDFHLHNTDVIRRVREVLETQVDDQPVLLHSTRWKYLYFTGSGGAIWQAIAEPVTFDFLVSSLCQRFAVEEATCRRETELFLQKLLEEEFITTS